VSRLRAHPAWVPVLIVTGLAVFMLALAGCGGDDDDDGGGGTTAALSEVGPGEGALNLVAWPSYVADPWKAEFEKQTGCKTSVKEVGTSDEMVSLMRTGQYDGISASGNASLRLVAGNDVDPVNLDLVPNYETIFDDLKDQPYNTIDGTPYGIPHGRGANLLMWNTDDVKPSPTSWSVILDPNEASKYKGKISIYDDSVYIADAAVYLKTHQPDLGIDNPYELDDEQFQAAVDLLKQQRTNVGEYWTDAVKQTQSFANKDVVVGTTWQYQYLTLTAENEPIGAPGPPGTGYLLPEEGATGWSDTWMISSEAAHPNCMYLWMDFIVSPLANSEVAQTFGEAPAQSKSCEPDIIAQATKALDFPADPQFCDSYKAADPAFWKNVYYWITPTADCGDDRGSVCTDNNEWVSAWNEIKG
jgi:putative spermidine/putrescine transport system substrate-binding protein